MGLSDFVRWVVYDFLSGSGHKHPMNPLWSFSVSHFTVPKIVRVLDRRFNYKWMCIVCSQHHRALCFFMFNLPGIANIIFGLLYPFRKSFQFSLEPRSKPSQVSEETQSLPSIPLRNLEPCKLNHQTLNLKTTRSANQNFKNWSCYHYTL